MANYHSFAGRLSVFNSVKMYSNTQPTLSLANLTQQTPNAIQNGQFVGSCFQLEILH